MHLSWSPSTFALVCMHGLCAYAHIWLQYLTSSVIAVPVPTRQQSCLDPPCSKSRADFRYLLWCWWHCVLDCNSRNCYGSQVWAQALSMKLLHLGPDVEMQAIFWERNLWIWLQCECMHSNMTEGAKWSMSGRSGDKIIIEYVVPGVGSMYGIFNGAVVPTKHRKLSVTFCFLKKISDVKVSLFCVSLGAASERDSYAQLEEPSRSLQTRNLITSWCLRGIMML